MHTSGEGRSAFEEFPCGFILGLKASHAIRASLQMPRTVQRMYSLVPSASLFKSLELELIAKVFFCRHSLGLVH
jgi:hypothetical protein